MQSALDGRKDGVTASPRPRAATLLSGNTPAVLINLVVLSVTTNLMVVLVSALLAVEQSSVWFACVSASALLFVTDMGVSYAFSRHLAAARGPTRRGALLEGGQLVLRHFLRLSWLPFLLLASVFGTYLLSAWVSTDGSHSATRLIGLWVMVAAYTFLAVLAKFLQMANEGLGKLAHERLIVSACQAVTFIVGAVLLYRFRSIFVLPVTYLAGYAVQATLLYLLARGGTHDHHVAIDREAMTGLAQESRGLWFLNLATVASQNVQVMSLAFLATPASVATFFFLQRLCAGASNFLGIIPVIDRARITGHVERGEFDLARKVLWRNFAIVMAATAVVTALLVAAILMIDWLGWLKFRIPTLLLLLFATDLLFSSPLGVLGQYILAAGRNPLIPWTIACSALTILLQFALVPSFGAIGAISAFLTAQLATTYLANLYYFVRLLNDFRRQSDG